MKSETQDTQMQEPGAQRNGDRWRVESDSIGEVRVPADRLWGAQTQRSLEHFSIGHDLIPPEMITAYAILKTIKVPVLVVNGRVSDRSFRRMRRLRPFLGPLLANVDRFGVQTPEDREKLLHLGVPPERVTVTGNLKYESPEPERKPALEAELARTPQAAAAGADASDGQAVAAGADNPAYLQVATQLDAIGNELRAEDAQEQRLKAQAADYQRKLSLSPEVEREYRSLTRESESAQLKYRDIRAKQMEAQVAQNLESDRKGERFTLIEPPLPPEDPVSPNRPLIMIVGLLASIALAIGIVAALEATDATVRGRKDMMDAFGVPILAIVPRIITATDIAAARRRVKYAVTASAAACLATIAAVHFLYRPLDVLWFAAMRHFGI